MSTYDYIIQEREVSERKARMQLSNAAQPPSANHTKAKVSKVKRSTRHAIRQMTFGDYVLEETRPSAELGL